MRGVKRHRVATPVLALILSLASGCARYVDVADGPQRSRDVADDLLKAESRTDGKHVTLFVSRGTRVECEQDFVRRRAESGSSAGRFLLRDPRVASIDGAWVEVAFYAAYGAVYVLYLVVEFVVESIDDIPHMIASLEVGRATTERWTDVRWEPSPGVTLDAADGGPPIDLGPQPASGYDLDPEILDRIGAHERPVVIRDGPRTTSVRIRRLQ